MGDLIVCTLPPPSLSSVGGVQPPTKFSKGIGGDWQNLNF